METFFKIFELAVLSLSSLGLLFFGLGFLLFVKWRSSAHSQSVDSMGSFQVLSISKSTIDFDDSHAEVLGADKKTIKERKKLRKKVEKTEDKPPLKRIFLIDFKGDIQASGAELLGKKISFVVRNASSGDRVVLRLESAGGVVHGYGFAAAQLQRLRAANIPLTVCVDQVAASGGYMMASVANEIVASPFAIIGSIGVIAGIPNLYKILRKNDVDYFEMTAGEFKRTLTLLGEPTEEKRDKMQTQLHETHDLFKEFVKSYRSQLDPSQVATGEYWFGTKALELGLIDKIMTSHAVLDDAMREGFKVLFLTEPEVKSPLKKLLQRFSSLQKGTQESKRLSQAVPWLQG